MTIGDSSHLPATDQTLIEELASLEEAMQRNYAWVYEIIAPFVEGPILEVGSGIGVMSSHLVARGDPVILSDHHPAYLERLRDRFGGLPNVTLQILDLNDTAYDVGRGSVRTIVCLNVLEHIERDEDVLARFAQLLDRGGRLVLQVPNNPSLFGSLDDAYGHYRRYTRASLAEKLAKAGFSPLVLRNFNPLAIPGWIVSAKLLRARRLNPRSLRAFNAIIPLARRLDFLSRFAGLALIACAER